MAIDCKSDTRQGGGGLNFYKFRRKENLKQQWLMKIKRRNIQSIQHTRICHACCFGLNPGRKKNVILAGRK